MRGFFDWWLPIFIVLCIPMIMGADGGEFLPAVYMISNAVGGWIGARNSVKLVRDELIKHIDDKTVHVGNK